jgi:hypothetical protein
VRKLVLSFAATALLSLAASAGPAAALPGPSTIATPETGIVTVQMSQRQRMMNRRMMRNRMTRQRVMNRRAMRNRMMQRRMMWRGAMMRGAPNARNPSRPMMQQQQGMTSGGPRY